jgi:hypothetical protein
VRVRDYTSVESYDAVWKLVAAATVCYLSLNTFFGIETIDTEVSVE